MAGSPEQANYLYQSFAYYFPQLIPTNTSQFQFFDIITDTAGKPIQCRSFGDLAPAETIGDGPQTPICQQLRTVTWASSVLHQVRLSVQNAEVVTVGEKQFPGRVTALQANYIAVEMDGNRKVAVPRPANIPISVNDWLYCVRTDFIEVRCDSTAYAATRLQSFYDDATIMHITSIQDFHPNEHRGRPSSGQYAAPQQPAASYPPAVSTEQRPPFQQYSLPADLRESLLHEYVDLSADTWRRQYPACSGEKRLPIKLLAAVTDVSVATINGLENRFTHWKRSPTDGNAYYRSIGVAYLEHCCRRTTPPEVLSRFISRILNQESITVISSLAGYYKYFYTALNNLQNSVTRKDAMSVLQTNLMHPYFDCGMVAVFRGLAHFALSQLLTTPKFASFFTAEDNPYALLAQIVTDKTPAEGSVFAAMAHAIDAKIVHIALTQAKYTEHSFAPLTPGRKVLLFVLLTPSHYDTLYPKNVQLIDQYSFNAGTFGGSEEAFPPDEVDRFEVTR